MAVERLNKKAGRRISHRNHSGTLLCIGELIFRTEPQWLNGGFRLCLHDMALCDYISPEIEFLLLGTARRISNVCIVYLMTLAVTQAI
jgi:hypothetical protein